MSVTFAQGFSAAGVEAGISSIKGKKDLALVVNNGPLDAAAGVFTANRFCAAPVQWSRKNVANGQVKAVILNSAAPTRALVSRVMSKPKPRHKKSPNSWALQPKTLRYAPLV